MLLSAHRLKGPLGAVTGKLTAPGELRTITPNEVCLSMTT
jgi:hypothetical protein